MGKSAQFPLHVWLPDAMEGPTPVSPYPCRDHGDGRRFHGRAPVASVRTFSGGADGRHRDRRDHRFFAATVGVAQNDIKRVVAYSTCSQLGYMFVALGLGAYAAGNLHLFTHAFFKALLFLGSGSVIHALHGEQDLRKMGGLRSAIPFTFAMMVIGTLSLTGFPFTAGFFSKDAIIEVAGLPPRRLLAMLTG